MTLRARLAAALAPEHDLPQTHDVFLHADRPIPEGAFRAAAVLVAITDRPAPGMIFTLRAAGLRAHGGQVAFPGGRLDPEDDHAVAAALREAEEEIGLPPDRVEILGRSDLFRTGTGFSIEPIVAVIPPDLPLLPAPDEVEAIFEAPLDYLLDPANLARHTVDWEGSKRSFYELNWDGHRIWGVTAAMLVNLARRIAAADATMHRL